MNSKDRSANDSGNHSWIEKIARLFNSAPKTRKDINDILEQAKDDHILELAVAAGAADIVTHNRKDFVSASSFRVRIVAPATLLGELT